MDSGDSNIILPFDFVSSEQFEIYFDTQDLKASIRFCNGTTLLDGKAFAEGATTDLKNGQKIEIEDVVFKVTTIRASAGTESSPGPKNDVQKEQRQSKLKGETLVNIPTLTSPHKDAMFNALPSQTIQQDSERVVQRPMLMPQIRLDSPTDGGSNTLTEGLPKLEDWRRGDFVGKGGYGQVFKHKPRHSAEVLAVKVVNFPEITPAWRRDIDKTEQIKDFNHKMTYIDREVDILLKVDHVSSHDHAISTLANMLSSVSYFERTKSFAIQKGWQSRCRTSRKENWIHWRDYHHMDVAAVSV